MPTLDRSPMEANMSSPVDSLSQALSYANFPQWYMYPPKLSYVPVAGRHRLDSALKTLSGGVNLYLHIPFCNMKCTFCTLFAGTGSSENSIEYYVRFLLRELDILSAKVQVNDLIIRNIYFGGGTPSVLGHASVAQIFDKFRSAFPVDDQASISVEFSPETVDHQTARFWRSMGANCASLGVQSFEDDLLASMNREYTSEVALRAIAHLRNGGFHYVNIDLIYGNQNQNESQWLRELQTATDSGATRVSLYPLATSGKPALNVQKKKGTFMPRSNATYRTLHSTALRHFRASAWSMTSALSFSSDNTGNSLEEAEANGIPTLGVGCGSRTYTQGIHVSSTPTTRRTIFGQELASYFDAIGRDSLPAASAIELSPEEQVRRQIILRIVGRGLPSNVVDVIPDASLRMAIGREICSLEENRLIFKTDKGIYLTDEGILRASEVGFRLASKSVRALVSETKE